MATPTLIELRFRLPDGNDIGPNKYTAAATVATLKEHVIDQWPKGVVTVHVVLRPPVPQRNNGDHRSDVERREGCSCSIL